MAASASGTVERGGVEATEAAWAAHGRSHLSATDVAVLARATKNGSKNGSRSGSRRGSGGAPHRRPGR